MKFPFFQNLWHNIGYMFGSFCVACLLLCLSGAVIAAALKFVFWIFTL